MKKIYTYVGLLIVVLVLATTAFYVWSPKIYTAVDVLPDVHIDAPDASIQLQKLDMETDDLLVDIVLHPTIEQQLFNAFEQATFTKVASDTVLDNDYFMRITYNRGYALFLDVAQRGIAVDDNRGTFDQYVFEDDAGFFAILEQATLTP